MYSVCLQSASQDAIGCEYLMRGRLPAWKKDALMNAPIWIVLISTGSEVSENVLLNDATL